MFFVLKHKDDKTLYVSGVGDTLVTSKKLNEGKLFSINIKPTYTEEEFSFPTTGGVDVELDRRLPAGIDGPLWELVPVDLRLV